MARYSRIPRGTWAALPVSLILAILMVPAQPAAATVGGAAKRAPVSTAVASAPCTTGGSSAGLFGLLTQILQPITEAACLLRSLRYEFYTVSVAPDGARIERVHSAFVGLPAILNVDGRGGADLVGTVTASGGLDQLSITINRAAGSIQPIAASVEVVATDPTGSVGAEKIAFGYDQRTGNVPPKFRADLQLGKLLDAVRPTLELAVIQSNGVGALSGGTKLIAATFDGTAKSRQEKVQAGIQYGKAPGAARLSYLMTEPGSLQLTTDRPGRVLGNLAFNGEQDVTVAVDARDMPNEFGVEFSLDNPVIRYTGSNGKGAARSIAALDVRLESDVPLLGRATQMRAAIKDLTSGTEISADSEAGAFSLTTNEPVGEIEVFAGDHPEAPDDLPSAGKQGARFVDRTGAPFVIGARVQKLSTLRAQVAESLIVEMVGQGGPFELSGEVDGLEASANIDDLPPVAKLSVDTATAALSYTGSAVIGRLQIGVETAEPIVAGANKFTLLLEDIPTRVDLRADLTAGAASFVANAPIGLVEVSAKSPGATDDRLELNTGQSGVVLRSNDENFFVFARLRHLEKVSFTTEPLLVETSMTAGQAFVADAVIGSDATAPVVRARLDVDALPAQLKISIDDASGDTDSAVKYRASERVGQIGLEVEGIELLEGANIAKAVINGVPKAVDMVFPAEGELASVVADEQIGQVRIAAGAGDVVLPARSLDNDPVLNDLFEFINLPGQKSTAARLTALRTISMSLDPIKLTMTQDAAKNRAIDLEAQFESEAGDLVTVASTLSKPGSRTSLAVELTPGQPTRLVFDNAAFLNRFSLDAQGLTGIRNFNAVFENVSPRMAICLDPGPACRRTNANVMGDGGGVSNGRPYDALVSMDFEDFGTHTPGFLPTTLDATVELDEGGTAKITDLRFENLSLDFGLGPDFKGGCTFSTSAFPRIYMFMDSRNRPFVINSIKFPPLVLDFQIGTNSQPARASSRIAWLKGCRDGHPLQLDRRSAGQIDCGGRKRMATAFGDIFDKAIVGEIVPLCTD